MSRVDRVVSLLESHAGSSIQPGRPSDDALIELLVHMASQDGVFEDAEIALLAGVLPGWSDGRVRAMLGEVSAQGLDLERLAAALEGEDQRWTALRFAVRMAWRDDHLDERERTFLDQLSEALQLPQGALDRVLHESARRPTERLEPALLREVLGSYEWSAADFADGPVESRDLLPHVPANATPVVRIGVDSAEVLGIYAEGLVGRFLEGASFLRWSEIVGCTRGFGLESSVRLHTENGRIWSIVDTRLGGIQMLIDRIYRIAPETHPLSSPTILGPATSPDTWDDSEA